MLNPQSPAALVDAAALVAQWLLAVPALLVVACILQRKRWRYDIAEAIIAGALTIAFSKIGGAAFAHARPFVVYGRAAVVPHAPDNAFPSDHLAACGLGFGYLWTRNRALAFAVLFCAALIAAARVLAGLHWPIDIAAGFSFGLAAAALGAVISKRAARILRRSPQ